MLDRFFQCRHLHSTVIYAPLPQHVAPFQERATKLFSSGKWGHVGPASRRNACRYPSEPLVDTKAWGELKGRGKDAIVAMREWGMSPRMIGGGLLLTLSDLGLGPKVDVIRLPRFDAVWPAPDKRPVRIRRVTLEDVFKRPAAAGEGLFKRLFKSATLEVLPDPPLVSCAVACLMQLHVGFFLQTWNVGIGQKLIRKAAGCTVLACVLMYFGALVLWSTLQ